MTLLYVNKRDVSSIGLLHNIVIVRLANTKASTCLLTLLLYGDTIGLFRYYDISYSRIPKVNSFFSVCIFFTYPNHFRNHGTMHRGRAPKYGTMRVALWEAIYTRQRYLFATVFESLPYLRFCFKWLKLLPGYDRIRLTCHVKRMYYN